MKAPDLRNTKFHLVRVVVYSRFRCLLNFTTDECATVTRMASKKRPSSSFSEVVVAPGGGTARTRTDPGGQSYTQRLVDTPAGNHKAYHERCGECTSKKPCAACKAQHKAPNHNERKRARAAVLKYDPEHQAKAALSNEARRDAYAASTSPTAAANEARRVTYAEGEAEARRDRYQPLSNGEKKSQPRAD
jgi:hypothetical protein